MLVAGEGLVQSTRDGVLITATVLALSVSTHKKNRGSYNTIKGKPEDRYPTRTEEVKTPGQPLGIEEEGAHGASGLGFGMSGLFRR